MQDSLTVQPPRSEEAYDEKFSTKLTAGVARRLRLHAALTGARIHDVVHAALDAHLPSLEELARAVDPAKNPRPGPQINSEEIH